MRRTKFKLGPSSGKLRTHGGFRSVLHFKRPSGFNMLMEGLRIKGGKSLRRKLSLICKAEIRRVSSGHSAGN